MLRNLAALVFGLAVALLGIEIAGRAWLTLWPAYQVIFLEPDPVLGWKQFPHHQYTWTGSYWWAADFSVPITTNADGFRDVDRRPGRVPGVRRVAVIGDSFVEALQVPFERTAVQILEHRLNATAEPGVRWEVLNVGISNFGVGQYLLAWEEYARRFDPRVVFVFVSPMHMRRTVTRYEFGAFPSTLGQALWIRPTFRLEAGALVREPAADYRAFVDAQRRVIATDFGGRRSRARETSVLRHYLAPYLAPRGPSRAPARRRLPHRPMARLGDREVLQVNRAILEELGRQVRATGGRLVVVGASPFEDPRPLERYCRGHGFGFVPLGRRLGRTAGAGTQVRWKHDPHFNEAGNEVFAAAMLDWMRAQGASSAP